jgi:protein-tyrosine phosphatase
MNDAQKIRILFCCMGNICRSPTAQGVFLHLATRQGLERMIEVDSAGTHAYHVGSAPDPRARAAALRRGIDISDKRARKLTVADFETFDYVLVMDRENLSAVEEICPPAHASKVQLLLAYAPHLGIKEVPDPYYGGEAGFERVLDMIEAAAEGLLAHILEKRKRGLEHFKQA